MKNIKNILCVILGFTLQLFAQSTFYNKEFRVNYSTEGAQWGADGVILDANKFAFTWATADYGNENYGIYVQLFDTNGVRISDEIKVNTSNSVKPKAPKILNLNNNKFVVLWADGTPFGQIFDYQGVKIGEQMEVPIFFSSYFDLNIKVLLLNSDKFVICWDSYQSSNHEKAYDVYFQIYNKNGTRIGSYTKVNSYTDNWQFQSDLILLPNSTFMVSWTGAGEFEESFGIYAKKYDFNGNSIDSEIHVNTNIEGKQENSSISLVGGKRIFICWESQHEEVGSEGIFGQMLDIHGNKIGSEIKINSSLVRNQGNLGIIPYGSGSFTVFWEGYLFDKNNLQIFAQAFNSNGQKMGTQYHNSENSWSNYDATFLVIDSNNYIITWTNGGADGWWGGVYGQLFNSHLSKIGAEFKINEYVFKEQGSSKLFNLNNNKFFATYVSSGQDGSGDGIYAKIFLNTPMQHILTNFSFVGPTFENLTTTDVRFVWNSASKIRRNFNWEIEYELFVSDDSTFNNNLIVNNSSQDTTYHTEPLEVNKTYYAKILAISYLKDSLWSDDVIKFYIRPDATDINGTKIITNNKFELTQNYPNPFNPTTVIKYQISNNVIPSSLPAFGVGVEGVNVQLKVYDVLGKEVVTLVNKEQTFGNYEVEFQANELPSGIYFYKLQAGSFVKTKTMVLLR